MRTNAAGYRGGPPAERAVLCLGDSTTFGWGVEEGEAWPARLAVHLGRDVVNGGVPGYSTFQGLATIDHALTLRPEVVVLAYLVRDAERAIAPDHLRVAIPTPPFALARLLRKVRAPRHAPTAADVFRVPPERYGEHLDALVARVAATGARAVLLAFPMRTPPEEHLAVLRARGALEVPLAGDAFFAEDPLHLTPAGNDTLARAVAEAL
ncbi:MAG: SGNH/GDSL hydrolase family protein [Myxococcota bacterium]